MAGDPDPEDRASAGRASPPKAPGPVPRGRGTAWPVERLSPTDRADAVVALARAFHRDPLFDFLVPDALSQARAALTFLGSLVDDAAAHGEVWVAHDGTFVTGAALWLPPGAYPRGFRRSLVSVLRDLRSVYRLGPRLGSAMRLYATIDRAHLEVTEPHWYLAVLGCDPGWQRRGVGTALLEPVLGRADHERSIVYLETQKEKNVPWYRRHGFDVVSELRPRGCPTMWAMRRDPR